MMSFTTVMVQLHLDDAADSNSSSRQGLLVSSTRTSLHLPQPKRA